MEICFKLATEPAVKGTIAVVRTEQLRKLGKLQSYYLDKFNLKGVFIRHQRVMQSSVAVKTAEQVLAPSRSVSSWELFNRC